MIRHANLSFRLVVYMREGSGHPSRIKYRQGTLRIALDVYPDGRVHLPICFLFRLL